MVSNCQRFNAVKTCQNIQIAEHQADNGDIDGNCKSTFPHVLKISKNGDCTGFVVYGLVSITLTLRSQPISLPGSTAWQCKKTARKYTEVTLHILDTADLSLCSELSILFSRCSHLAWSGFIAGASCAVMSRTTSFVVFRLVQNQQKEAGIPWHQNPS